MITVVDYRAGNITSVQRALSYLGIESRVSDIPDEIKNAERIIFPGVGNALSSMNYLNGSGIGEALKEACAKHTPLLGICLGTQIIFSYSEEGGVECLGLVAGRVRKLVSPGAEFKIPHMGWNSINIKRDHFLFQQLDPLDEFYFVHSYYVEPSDNEVILADCDYIIDIPVVITYKNIAAVQFHPEKSGAPGLSILERFSKWDGCDN